MPVFLLPSSNGNLIGTKIIDDDVNQVYLPSAISGPERRFSLEKYENVSFSPLAPTCVHTFLGWNDQSLLLLIWKLKCQLQASETILVILINSICP